MFTFCYFSVDTDRKIPARCPRMCASSSSGLGDRGVLSTALSWDGCSSRGGDTPRGDSGTLHGHGLQQCGKELPWEEHQWLHKSVLNISDVPCNIASKMAHDIYTILKIPTNIQLLFAYFPFIHWSAWHTTAVQRFIFMS